MLSEAASCIFPAPETSCRKVVSACLKRSSAAILQGCHGKMHSSCYHPSLGTSTSQTSHIENSWTDYQNGPREIYSFYVG